MSSSLSKVFGAAERSSSDEAEDEIITALKSTHIPPETSPIRTKTWDHSDDEIEIQNKKSNREESKISSLSFHGRDPNSTSILKSTISSPAEPTTQIEFRIQDSENFELNDIYENEEDKHDDFQFIGEQPRKISFANERGRSPQPSTSTLDTKTTATQKAFVTINDLNEKFVTSNFYYVLAAIILYIGIGIVCFDHMTDWGRFESLYFIIITIMTVGYGDFVPEDTGTRIFTAFYILVGVTVFGSLIGTVSTFFQDHQDRMARQRSMRAMLKMQEKEAELLRSRNSTAYNPLQGEGQLSSANTSGHGISLLSFQSNSNMNDLLTATRSADNVTSNDGGARLERKSTTGFRRLSLLSFSSTEKRKEKTLSELRDASIAAYEEDRQQLKRSAFFDVIRIFLIIIFGMGIMCAIEGWSSGDAFYWATVTIFTVGYGDFTPDSVLGKVFTMFYCVIGCAFMAKVVTDFVKFPLTSRVLKHEIEVVNQFTGDLSPEMLETLFNHELYQLVPDLKRNEEEMSKCEFVLLILQTLSKIEEKDIFLAAKLFDNFDKMKNGYLSKEDMSKKVKEARRREQERERMNSLQSQDSGRGATLLNRLRDRLPSMRNIFQQSDENNSRPNTPQQQTRKRQTLLETTKVFMQGSPAESADRKRTKAKSVGAMSNLQASLVDNEIPQSQPKATQK